MTKSSADGRCVEAAVVLSAAPPSTGTISTVPVVPLPSPIATAAGAAAGAAAATAAATTLLLLHVSNTNSPSVRT